MTLQPIKTYTQRTHYKSYTKNILQKHVGIWKKVINQTGTKIFSKIQKNRRKKTKENKKWRANISQKYNGRLGHYQYINGETN